MQALETELLAELGFAILTKKRMTNLSKDDDNQFLVYPLKAIFTAEPQNKEDLIGLLRDAHSRALIDSEALGMIEGVLQFAQMRVRDIMLPKKQMTCISRECQTQRSH